MIWLLRTVDIYERNGLLGGQFEIPWRIKTGNSTTSSDIRIETEFIESSRADLLKLRRGDWVKVKGVWADIDDESIFIAAKIRKDNNYAFKVRLTSDGQPFWTMSADKLAMEKAAVE